MAYGSVLTDTVQSSTAATPVVFKDGNGTQIGTLCRAWVNFNGTGTVAIRGSFNVTSITDNGTGNFTVNFTNAMPDANYTVVTAGSQQANDCLNIKSGVAPTTTAVNIQGYSRSDTYTAADGEYNMVAIFR